MKLERIQPLYDTFKEYTTFGYSNKGSDYSVTDLIRPPRIVQLSKRHDLEIEKDLDIIGTLGSFRGNAIHEYFKKYLWRVIMKSGTNDYLIESRLWDRINSRKISGQIDCLFKDILYDFKTTSVWKKIFGDTKEWEEQLNLYVYLLHLIQVKVNQINVIAWYQDWDKMKMYNNKQYPRQEMELLPIDLWPIKKSNDFMFHRTEIHKNAELLSDDDLPHCTMEDMWAKEDTWAVYKVANGKLASRASRVLKSLKEAQHWMMKQKDTNFRIVERPGERTRCKDWCHVAPFCNQWAEYMEGK